MNSRSTPTGEPVPIGEFAEPNFVRLPEPVLLFRARAERLRSLAPGHALAPYLIFLADLATIQARLATNLALPEWRPKNGADESAGEAMPPVARARFPVDHRVLAVGDALLAVLARGPMPDATAGAVERLRSADAAAQRAAFERTLAEPRPTEVLAEHALLSAALQIVFAGIAATFQPEQVRPVADGACPVCGSPPLASLRVGWPGASGTRYCACGLCGTLWNTVRIKCTLCGSTRGITYHAIEGDEEMIKAESCKSCHRYVKILRQDKAPALEPLADDVASLGLDFLMREVGFARGAVNPFLLGY